MSVCDMDIRKRLATNIKLLRKAQDWSQEELADRAGLHRTYISGVERGVRNPTITVLVGIAEALGVSAGELLG
jgi:transcriptional regulator with XRE-family HTH domain